MNGRLTPEPGRSRENDYECVASPPDVIACANPDDLGATYTYLLGLYLGDGCISASRRGVWRLRIFQDARYRHLIQVGERAMSEISGRPTGRLRGDGCVELSNYWKHWPCVLPQHGPGRKHRRRIVRREWPRRCVDDHPREFLRGLIHSDGNRTVNRIRRRTVTGVVEYAYVRYFFTNASPDIRALFAGACAQLGIDCRRTTERVLSVARRDSVSMLDLFVGPKA